MFVHKLTGAFGPRIMLGTTSEVHRCLLDAKMLINLVLGHSLDNVFRHNLLDVVAGHPIFGGEARSKIEYCGRGKIQEFPRIA